MGKIKPFGFGKKNHIQRGSRYSNNSINSANEELLKVYFEEINKYQLLSAQEEKELFIKYKNGDSKAKEKIIQSNLRFVVSIAGNFCNRGLSFLDLVEEGNLGLIKAVDHFKQETGYRFSTYASWWVYQSITRALVDTGKPIRVPNYLISKVGAFKRFINKIKSKESHEVNIEYYLEKTGLDEISKAILKQAFKADSTSVIHIDNFGDDDNKLDLEDKKTKTPEEIVAEKLEISNLEMKLKILNHRDAEILKMRYGLNGYQPMTLEMVGKKVKLSRERVRQIEIEGLRKLNYLLAY